LTCHSASAHPGGAIGTSAGGTAGASQYTRRSRTWSRPNTPATPTPTPSPLAKATLYVVLDVLCSRGAGSASPSGGNAVANAVPGTINNKDR
jgi:hypothetical protein